MTINTLLRSGIAAATIVAAIAIASVESANAQRLTPATVLSSYSAIGAPVGVAAIVNGETIPTDRVANVALRLTGGKILDQLIGYVLIEQEAKRRGIIVTQEEVDTRVDEIRQMVSPHSLDDVLRARNMSVADFQADIRSGITVRKLLQNKLTPVKMAHVRDLFVNVSPFAGMAPNLHTAARADAIMSTVCHKLKGGASFEELAKEYGDASIEGNDAGDLGIVTNFPNADQNAIARGFSHQTGFLDKCLSLGKGQVAEKPLRSRFGLHLIRVISTSSDPLPNEGPLYADIREKAIEDQVTRLAPPFVESLRRKGKVAIYLGAAIQGPSGIAATVNGEDVPLSKVTEIALSSEGPNIVETMIDTLLVEQAAVRQHVVIAPARIDAAIANLLHQSKVGSIEDLLQYGHMTLAEFRETQKAKIEAEEMVAQNVGQMKAAHLLDILIRIKPDKHSRIGHSEVQANTIVTMALNRLHHGDKFKDVARRYSEDFTSNTHGGDLGIVTEKDAYEPAFLTAAMGLKKGQFTLRPVLETYGLHLLQSVSTLSDHPAAENKFYHRAEQTARQREIWTLLPGFIAGLRIHASVINYLNRP